jgi:hypothetical protein
LSVPKSSVLVRACAERGTTSKRRLIVGLKTRANQTASEDGHTSVITFQPFFGLFHLDELAASPVNNAGLLERRTMSQTTSGPLGQGCVVSLRTS